MDRFFLAPLGRAEPDDGQGWMEQGGFLGLQRALSMESTALREALNGVERRDGQGALRLEAGHSVGVNVTLAPAPHPARLLLEELPLWLLEGALVLALACEQPRISVYLYQAERDHRALLTQAIHTLHRLGLLGDGGWMRLVIDIRPDPPPLEALDALTVYLLPIVLWQRRDPGTTLLAADGAVAAPGVYEIPLGLSMREFVYSWAGGVSVPHPTFSLGGELLEGAALGLPLDFKHFGRALGRGPLRVSQA